MSKSATKKTKRKKLDAKEWIRLVSKGEASLEEVRQYTALDCKLASRAGIEPITYLFPASDEMIRKYIARLALRGLVRHEGLTMADLDKNEMMREYYTSTIVGLMQSSMASGQAMLAYLATYAIASGDPDAVAEYERNLPQLKSASRKWKNILESENIHRPLQQEIRERRKLSISEYIMILTTWVVIIASTAAVLLVVGIGIYRYISK